MCTEVSEFVISFLFCASISDPEIDVNPNVGLKKKKTYSCSIDKFLIMCVYSSILCMISFLRIFLISHSNYDLALDTRGHRDYDRFSIPSWKVSNDCPLRSRLTTYLSMFLQNHLILSVIFILYRCEFRLIISLRKSVCDFLLDSFLSSSCRSTLFLEYADDQYRTSQKWSHSGTPCANESTHDILQFRRSNFFEDLVEFVKFLSLSCDVRERHKFQSSSPTLK